MKLHEARYILQYASLYAGDNSFGEQRLDRAIHAICVRFKRQTGYGRTVATVDTTADQSTVALTASDVPNFAPGRVFSPVFIEANGRIHDLEMIAWGNYRDRREFGGEGGRPRAINFRTPALAYVYPIPDQVYTLNIPYENPGVSWSVGGDPDADIELPDEFADDLIYWGAKAYLLWGVPKHRDEAKAAWDIVQGVMNEAEGLTAIDGAAGPRLGWAGPTPQFEGPAATSGTIRSV